MNLLYVWNDNYDSDFGEKGYLLNSKYNIQFNKRKMKLRIERNNDYMERFWGEHVFDAVAVVGKNGTGKTRLANCIMDTLGQLETRWPVKSDWHGPQFIIAFEDVIEGKKGIKIFLTNQFKDISVDSTLNYKRYSAFESEEIEKFKFAYFNNVLDMTDYKNERYGVVFDASVGGSINKSFRHNLEMHYIDAQKDKISNYYEDEIMKMLDFVSSGLGNTKIPFVLPKYIKVTLADYKINLRYISREIEKMNKKDINLFLLDTNSKDILNDSCSNILKMYGNSWSSYLVVNLILNLFKELCIPQTSADHLESETLEFLKVLNRIDDLYDENIFIMMLKLLDNIRNYKNEHEINVYRKFIYWLLETRIFSEDKREIAGDTCYLYLPKDISIVRNLFYHYKKTNFAYPYLTFDFGLSTGEFNFLKLFSKIAELTRKDANGKRYVENNITHEVRCENVFLYFDEVDLSLHPEWQRQYVDWLLQFINTYFENCTVQILIATHSPIMLSDFPENNVLYLWKEGEKHYMEKKNIKTFGNNVHTLFMDSFFLSDAGTMGAYAEKKINEIAGDLKNNRDIKTENTLKIIDSIGDDIIRNKLRQMYNDKMHIKEQIWQEKPDETIINSTIGLIKRQIQNLQNTLDELERMKSDKDRTAF